MPPALATARLALRPCDAARDAPDLLALFGGAGVRRFLFDDQAPTAAQVEAMLEGWAALAPRGLGGWMLLEAAAAAPVGWVGLLPVGSVARFAPRLAGEVEPMIALAEPHWGRGLGREALSAVIAHGFATLRLPRLVAVADAPNRRSVRMLRAAGFQEDGEAPGPVGTLCLFRLEAGPR